MNKIIALCASLYLTISHASAFCMASKGLEAGPDGKPSLANMECAEDPGNPKVRQNFKGKFCGENLKTLFSSMDPLMLDIFSDPKAEVTDEQFGIICKKIMDAGPHNSTAELLKTLTFERKLQHPIVRIYNYFDTTSLPDAESLSMMRDLLISSEIANVGECSTFINEIASFLLKYKNLIPKIYGDESIKLSEEESRPIYLAFNALRHEYKSHFTLFSFLVMKKLPAEKSLKAFENVYGESRIYSPAFLNKLFYDFPEIFPEVPRSDRRIFDVCLTATAEASRAQ